METAEVQFYRIKLPKAWIAVAGVILTVLVFIVLVETSYFRWQSNFLVLTKFLVMALICNSGVFFSLTHFGRRYKILTLLPLVFALIAVPLIVGYFHTIIAVASMAIILLTIVELFRKRG